MAATIANTGAFVQTASQTTHTLSLTVSSGVKRTIAVIVAMELGSTTNTGVTFDGNAMTNVLSYAHSTLPAQQLVVWYLSIADGVGAGSYNVVATTSPGGANVTVYGWELTGVTPGAPEATATDEGASGDGSMTCTLTATDGAILVGAANDQATAPTWTISGDVTERLENNETGMTTVSADGVVSGAGTKTMTAVASSTAAVRSSVLVSFAAASTATNRRASHIRRAIIHKYF
jgi:hypothetical protein